jgi:hypothetical protein
MPIELQGNDSSTVLKSLLDSVQPNSHYISGNSRPKIPVNVALCGQAVLKCEQRVILGKARIAVVR